MSRSRKHTGKNRIPPEMQQPQAKRVRGHALMQSLSASPAVFLPTNQSVLDQMYQQQAPQDGGTPFYAPGAPIRPIPGITPEQGPRQFSFPVGYNISQQPRGTEEYSFEELRSLARLFDAVQLCEQAWFDYVSKLEMDIEPRPELVEEDMDTTIYDADIQYYKDFFAFPDKEHDLKSWLRMAVKDQLEIDAVAIYVRRNKVGGIYSLDLLDGATIKPLVDDRGRRPQPPYPAYEQFLYGTTPAALLDSDDLLYVKETDRTDSVYGTSRVERIVLRINQALRKQSKDLAKLTDGTVPSGVIEVPSDTNWTTDQIEKYEFQLNNLLGGNDQERARVKILGKGMTYKPTDDAIMSPELDTFVLNITAGAFGLSMDELAFTAGSNRSVGQTQENMVYRRSIQPLMSRYADLLTHILRKYFNENRFIVKWKGFEEVEDFNAQATAYAALSNAGIVSPSRAAHLMHLPVDFDLPSPIIQTKSGPILLEDFANQKLRTAQMNAQMAGLQMAAENPGAKPADPAQDGQQAGDEEEDAPTSRESEKPSQPHPDADRTHNAEYRRWRDATLNDLKAGRAIRRFASDLIPSSTLVMGHIGLQQCQTPDAVKQFFQAMREAVYA